jgi:ribonuclease P protein component
MRFSRHFRLQKPEQFQRVFAQASHSGDRCFRVLARPNGFVNDRLGMAVSKKNCPRAVGRNRIKRVVRESFRTRLAGRPASDFLDFVVLPSAAAAERGNAELFRSLNRHWQKLAAMTTTANAGKRPGPNERAALTED